MTECTSIGIGARRLKPTDFRFPVRDRAGELLAGQVDGNTGSGGGWGRGGDGHGHGHGHTGGEGRCDKEVRRDWVRPGGTTPLPYPEIQAQLHVAQPFIFHIARTETEP
jgi:hypothetical protein